MKSCIEINVEIIAGTSIEDAIKEAKEKARQWNVAHVCFGFNGKKMSVGENADIEDTVNRYYSENDNYVVGA